MIDAAALPCDTSLLRVLLLLQSLVKQYGSMAAHIVQAAHPSTAARCNLNKCSAKGKAKYAFPSQADHFAEMRKATFCLVPRGDSPPSSRLYLAVAAGCIPVLISDSFDGVFATTVPWHTFSLRVPEASIAAAGGRRGQANAAAAASLNLTSHLLSIVDTPGRLKAMQEALEAHAADVLWEAPGSRVGDHALGLATMAARRVCAPGAPPSVDEEAPASHAASATARRPQIHLAAPEAPSK